MKMDQAGKGKCLTGFDLAEESRTILLEDPLLEECEPTVAGEVTTFRFVSGAL